MSQPFADLPFHQKAYFKVTDVLKGCSVALEGSGVNSSNADCWSDIDLVVEVAHKDSDVGPVNFVRAKLQTLDELFVLFSADHLGLTNLLVSCLKIEDSIVKVDIKIHCSSYKYPDPLPPNLWDFNDLIHRGCGWTWYTATKIFRGELLEAADGLDLLRRGAVIQIWQDMLNLPREGYRHAEHRLPFDFQQRLWDSRPQNRTKQELMRCLKHLFQLMVTAYRQKPSIQIQGIDILTRKLDEL